MKIIKKRHLHSLLAVLLLICSMTACANTPAKVEIPEISGVNACNYIAWNEMDCSDGYLALYSEQLLGTTLTVYDADGRVARISNASQSFRLCGTDLFYIKSDRLMRQNLPDGYTMEIAREAASFVVHKTNCIIARFRSTMMRRMRMSTGSANTIGIQTHTGPCTKMYSKCLCIGISCTSWIWKTGCCCAMNPGRRSRCCSWIRMYGPMRCFHRGITC